MFPSLAIEVSGVGRLQRLYIHMCMCLYVYVSLCACVSRCMCLYVYVSLCMCLYAYVSLCACLYACYVCVCKCVYMCAGNTSPGVLPSAICSDDCCKNPSL